MNAGCMVIHRAGVQALFTVEVRALGGQQDGSTLTTMGNIFSGQFAERGTSAAKNIDEQSKEYLRSFCLVISD